MTRRTATRAATATVIVALVAAGWLLLAPPELGGHTRYAIVQGSSMEPVLSTGDLAVVRSGGTVSVGDVVLYRDAHLGVDVLHRVLRLERDALVLKGDSNDFLDDGRPRTAEIEGSLWFAVPYAGAAFVWIREPLNAALVVFVLTLVALIRKPADAGVRGRVGRA
jgi:signal peptidase